MSISAIAIAGLAVAGTVIQMLQSTIDLAKFRPGSSEAVEVERERRAHKLWRDPANWLRDQVATKRRLWPKGGADAATQELRSAWLWTWGHVIGWALLMAAALGALAAAVADL